MTKTRKEKADIKKGENYRVGFQAGEREGFAEALKACGGCRLCYGKGYSTQQTGKRTKILPCLCPRGKQFDDLTILIRQRDALVEVK